MAPNSAPSFTADRLERLLVMERRHFWFGGRRALVRRLMDVHLGSPPKTVLDLGAGGGYFCQLLAVAGYQMTAVDFLALGLRRLRRDEPAVRTVQSSGEAIGLRDESHDAALALDVLEHIDDRAAAAELHRILRPGGVLFLTVPAFPFLWSYRDTAAGHKRRYRKAGLESVLREAGFDIERVGYYQFWLLPLAALSRWAGKDSHHTRDWEDMPPAPVNAVLDWVNRTEVRWGEIVRWPWGSTLYAVARRRRLADPV